MRKLLVCSMAIMAIVTAKAAAYEWTFQIGSQIGGAVYAPGKSTTLSSATAYLFEYEDLSDVFASKGYDSDLVVKDSSGNAVSASVNNGLLANTTFKIESSTEDYTLHAFFTIVDGDYFYVSGDKSADGTKGTAKLTFSEATASKAAVKQLSDGYQGAGWYEVPEPTSGMLMLLGFAGLALRRKRV